MGREVDDDLAALGGSQAYDVEADRVGHQPLVGRDLMNLSTCIHRQPEKPAVRAVDDPKAIPARFHVEIRIELAVHENGVAARVLHPRHLGIAGCRVVELAVRPQQAIADEKRNIVSDLVAG